jgi:hypothetical protein
MGGWLRRTAPPDHERAAIAVVRDAYVAGDISLADYEDRVEHILTDEQEARAVAIPGTLAARAYEPLPLDQGSY